jgi:hypothetical protein
VSLLERLSLPRRLTLDSDAALGGQHARATGRSWWALRYRDGRIVHEWDADPGSPNGHHDWPRMAMLGQLHGVQALRLFAPNGKMAEVGGEGDQTGRLFQFKRAVRYAVMMGSSVTPGREVLGHVIGMLTGHNGECVLYAWEPLPEPAPPPGAPPQPHRPGYFNREQPAWALKEQHERYLAEQAAFDAFMQGKPMRQWAQEIRDWEAAACGRLIGPIEDNVYDLRYGQVGKLNADVLGLADGEGR